MAFDWKTFQQAGLGPAMGTWQTYLQHGLQSGLYKQTHEQRLKESEQEYKYKEDILNKEYVHRERLANVQHNLDRSLVLDNAEIQTNRLIFTDYLEGRQEGVKQTNRMELERLRTDAGLKRANVYKEIAQINNQINTAGQFNPDLPAEINRNTFQSLMEDYDYLNQEMLESEQMVQGIQSNPLYQKSMAGEVDQFDTQQMPWFREASDQLAKAQKYLRDSRKSQRQVKNEIIKFAFDAKIPNPLDDSAAFKAMAAMGIPPPVGGRPRSTLSLAEHMRALEELVIMGNDLPDDFTLRKANLDVGWTKTNWPQYRDFFRAHQAAAIVEFLAETTLREPTRFLKDLGKMAGAFFQK